MGLDLFKVGFEFSFIYLLPKRVWLKLHCISPSPAETGKNNDVSKVIYTTGVYLIVHFLACLEIQ